VIYRQKSSQRNSWRSSTLKTESGVKSPAPISTKKKKKKSAGISDGFSLDPSITRGLDYYTGVVFETFLNELPDIGSICSGGRYDNLAGLYSKNRISGVGSSIGLDRMIAALESLGKLPATDGFTAAAIACVKQEDSGLYQSLATQFRQSGVPCEVFLEAADTVKQFILAEKKGLRWMIIPGSNPLNDPLTLRNLKARKNHDGLSVAEAVKLLTTSE
jgi:histidyl-tRNA synthetase